jgi:MFS family permease
MGLFATALAVGGVIGPLASGLLVQHLGFRVTFFAFAVLAGIGALVFTKFVPETRPGKNDCAKEVPDMAAATPEAV